jgi:hypothetical protein
MSESIVEYLVNGITALVVAFLGFWNRTQHKAIADAEAKAVRAAELAGVVKDQLAAHKLFVAENYSSKAALRETEERIARGIENIERMVRQLVAADRTRNTGE